MKAMILTAGKGERLLPLTRKYPKPLFPVGDRPVLFYLFDLLKEYGIKDVVLNLHHQGEILKKRLQDGGEFGLRISYSEEEELLGTGGGVKKASPFWDGEDVLVINGDNILELNLEKLLQVHRAHRPAATMVVKPRTPSQSYTPLYLDPEGFVKAIGGKAADTPGFAFLGAQILSPEFLRFLPEHGPACLIEDGYRKALKARRRIATFTSTGYWREISTPEFYWEANADFLKGRSPLYFYRGREEFTRRGIHAGKGIQLGPRINFYYPVYLGDGCRIGGVSVLGPAALVGAGAAVGEECKLRNVVMWPQTEVLAHSDLHDLIITPFGKLSLEK
jgi:NDP-sugar pyrophosphorylase family protein